MAEKTNVKEKNVYEKLMTVQSELKAPKENYNSFGKYKYRSCEDILEAVKPLLKQEGVVVILSDEVIIVGERYYIKATAKFMDITTGDFLENVALAREDEAKKGCDGSQITGGASSYARKYALNGLLCIDDTQDADTQDNSESGKQSETKPVAQTKTAPKVEATSAQYVRGSGDKVEVKTRDGWKQVGELTVDQLKTLRSHKEYEGSFKALDAELANRTNDEIVF